ncbi:MAG: GNAT family N-acetyltransferase [Campylobacteraceae bacterium]|nr:GNAT family N-acetyltransferase [Campylobacteraceae bacterium]
MNIIKCSINDAEELSNIIVQANKSVAKQFSLNINNCSTHPSFCTSEWVVSDFNKGAEYFIYQKDKINVGCVSFENKKEGIAYLNRLCVLPDFQGDKIGENLVSFIISYAKEKNIKSIRIAIITDHIILKNWYIKLGFKEGLTKEHSHLPFKVMQLSYSL